MKTIYILDYNFLEEFELESNEYAYTDIGVKNIILNTVCTIHENTDKITILEEEETDLYFTAKVEVQHVDGRIEQMSVPFNKYINVQRRNRL